MQEVVGSIPTISIDLKHVLFWAKMTLFREWKRAKGGIAKWLNAVACKATPLGVRGFESLSHH